MYRSIKKNRMLNVCGARENNLKRIDVEFPLGLFICITGVSGSGKSTLLEEIVYRSLMRHIYNSRSSVGKCDAIHGLEHVDRVINIDQSPIGRTPRSNPITYIDAFSVVRNLFAMVPSSREGVTSLPSMTNIIFMVPTSSTYLCSFPSSHKT